MENNILKNSLLKVSKVLLELKTKGNIDSYGLIGGLAIGSLGIPRATRDVDFLVSTENVQKFYEELKKSLVKENLLIKLKKPEYKKFPYYCIICYEKESKQRIVDILVLIMKWQDEISHDIITIDFNGQKIPVINNEGLIILKLKAGSPIDIIDVKNMLKVVDINKLNHDKLKNWAKRAGVNKLLDKILRNVKVKNEENIY